MSWTCITLNPGCRNRPCGSVIRHGCQSGVCGPFYSAGVGVQPALRVGKAVQFDLPNAQPENCSDNGR